MMVIAAIFCLVVILLVAGMFLVIISSIKSESCEHCSLKEECEKRVKSGKADLCTERMNRNLWKEYDYPGV